MIRKIAPYVLAVSIIFTVAGCFSQNFVVGNGAQGNKVEETRHWYILWGLVPLNDVDTQKMAGGAKDYTINTQQSFVDIVIGIFTGIITVYPVSVSVTH